MRASSSDAHSALASPRRAGSPVGSRARRVALAVVLAIGFAGVPAAQAGAFTLRLAFPDGQPMTYGSACSKVGCMQRGEGVASTDSNGEIYLPGSVKTIEYRRDGLVLGMAPAGAASGTLSAIGDRATVVLPRLLTGSEPALNAIESDLVARLNDARAAQGLSLAQINPGLAKAADMQATWLVQSGVTFAEPGSFHSGPFQSDMAFRKGEVSLPDPASGGEIAEAGGTTAETVGDWLSSPLHRELILAPGKLLIGAANVGIFTIVATHRPCDGCVQAGTGTPLSADQPPLAPGGQAPPPALVPAAPPVVAAVTTAGSGVAPALPACGRERLTTRRLHSRYGRVRLRVSTQCLRPRARYALLVRQGATGRLLRTVRITRAGAMTLRLRPARSATRLRITLKRDARVIISRMMSLRM